MIFSERSKNQKIQRKVVHFRVNFGEDVKEAEWVICDSFNEGGKKKGKQIHGIQLKYEMVAKGKKRDCRGNRSN